jgi:hypothetical protein
MFAFAQFTQFLVAVPPAGFGTPNYDVGKASMAGYSRYASFAASLALPLTISRRYSDAQLYGNIIAARSLPNRPPQHTPQYYANQASSYSSSARQYANLIPADNPCAAQANRHATDAGHDAYTAQARANDGDARGASKSARDARIHSAQAYKIAIKVVGPIHPP